MPQRRPRLLYLAFYFPPSRASGVYRARATANRLTEEGWDVTVFAAPLPFLYETVGSVDEKLSETVDPRISVVRPKLNRYTWQTELRDFSRFRRTFPHLAHSMYEWGQRHVFPERYVSWARASVIRALRMHARRRFDVVLATGNPFASFGAAWAFHRLTRTPYIIDYRDSWTLDLFSEEPAFDEGHPAWTWERRIIKSAAATVFVNDALRTWHAGRYPDQAERMLVVPNGWDADTLPATVKPPPVARSREKTAPRFSYLGTLTGKQPIEPMLEAFGQAREHPDMAGAELGLHGYLGFFKGSGRGLNRRLAEAFADAEGDGQGPTSWLRYHGPVSKIEVAEVYRTSDVLVFLAGGARYVTSGKIFEYMAAGRPIVSVHAPGSAAEEVLRGYPLWFNPGGLDPADIAASLIEAAKTAAGLDDRQVAEARAYAERYERNVSLEPLVRRLAELATARGHAPAGDGRATE
ncbi:glycosyltransferase [Actinomadura sp. SCN-SB]|uniref:glycosyltransferase n=1 Tax=Actinomadura sp. SCN-SB TaxID=3373092 RepID=UPI00375387BE